MRWRANARQVVEESTKIVPPSSTKWTAAAAIASFCACACRSRFVQSVDTWMCVGLAPVGRVATLREVSVVIAVLLAREHPGPIGWAGIGAVVAGAVLAAA